MGRQALAFYDALWDSSRVPRVLLGYWGTVGYYEVLDGTVLKELGETNMSWMSLKWFACRSSLRTHSTTKAKFGCVYATLLHVACGLLRVVLM